MLALTITISGWPVAALAAGVLLALLILLVFVWRARPEDLPAVLDRILDTFWRWRR